MIATLKAVSLSLVTACLLAGVAAWAGEPPDKDPGNSAPAQTDWSQFEAEAERGFAAYDAGKYAAAKAILLPLAEAGHPKAMNMVGLMHDGTKVFPNDPKLECDWYERAAKAGYASAMYNLSICFNHGRGRPQDSDKMLKWRTDAALLGIKRASINLAALDESEGPEFRRWMLQAAEHGSRFALVSLWLSGYEDDAWENGMTIQDIVCMYWRVYMLEKSIESCD